jgi:adenylate kinase family enzyme
MNRAVVVGATGSGKTVLASRLAEALNVPHIDLDALHWQPCWQPTPTDVFRQRVEAAIGGERWILGGNYSKVRDLTWAKADTLIWLDYPLWIVMLRLFRRTMRRIYTQEDLWGTGNRESWRKQFFSRDSLFLWALKTHSRYWKDYPRVVSQPEYVHLAVVRLHAPREADQWLNRVKQEHKATV